MALAVDGVVVHVVPLCPQHAYSVMQGRWAVQLEPEWGGPWLRGTPHKP
jgi:hypothetical protein